MKHAAFALVAVSMGVVGAARADEHATCDAAFEASELQLRPSETHLLRARESLRACALPTCQGWMIDDCTKRLVEVDGRIPSVVFSADNGEGTPLYDVRILDGEQELATRIDGRAVEMEPGPHAFVAERDGTQVKLDVVVIEGRRAQQIVFAFPAPVRAPAPIPVPLARPVPTLAHPWARPVAGGLLAGGVVATGIGIGFGIAAITRKSDAHCNNNDVCQGNFNGALDDAHLSTGGFIVGGVLAVAGVVTYLVFGRSRLEAAW